jgi:hypothetical protein
VRDVQPLALRQRAGTMPAYFFRLHSFFCLCARWLRARREVTLERILRPLLFDFDRV